MTCYLLLICCFEEKSAKCADMLELLGLALGECDYETVPLCTVMLDVCYCVAALQQNR